MYLIINFMFLNDCVLLSVALYNQSVSSSYFIVIVICCLINLFFINTNYSLAEQYTLLLYKVVTFGNINA